MTRYLADTYAFIEALTGHPRYGRIVSSGKVATTAMNVLELHYSLLRRKVAVDEAERLSRATFRCGSCKKLRAYFLAGWRVKDADAAFRLPT